MIKKYFKMIVAFVVAVSILVVSTVTYAKYFSSRKSNVEVLSEQQFWSKKYTDTGKVNNYFEFQADYYGYYAVIVKGGDGGNGNTGESNNWSSRVGTGGSGGIMFGIFDYEKDGDINKLRFYLGNKGTDSTKSQQSLAGGTNGLDFAKGGTGGHGTGSYANASSGSGGAGSVVYGYAGSTAGKLIIIAGGGGSSPGWDKYYQKSEVGYGGNGGSNFSFSFEDGTSVTQTNIASSIEKFGEVYSGEDGTNTISSTNTFGKGGTVVGGSGATGVNTTGNTGTNFLNNGNGYFLNILGVDMIKANAGNGANSKNSSPAGVGGGGFTGGGGGGHTSLASNRADQGGGGGGSSYINKTFFSLDKYENVNVLTKIYQTMHERSGYSPKDIEDGYAIVMYLGKNNPENTEILTESPLSEDDFYYGTYSNNGAVSVTAKNTGYYCVIAKGGNGGDGYKYNGGIKENINGGIGGVTYSYVYATAGNSFNVYLGSKGGMPVPGSGSDGKTPGGAGGINAFGYGLGANGSNYKGNWDGLTNNMASAGGGAATIICFNGNTNADVLTIAGGGGGGASWDEGMSWGASFYASGGGGAAGATSVPLDDNAQSISIGDFSGYVFPGLNGLPGAKVDPKNAYGFGGSSVGGLGGTSTQTNVMGLTISSQTGSSGQGPSGLGVGGVSVQHGGAGGGGFAGGGGGSGTSISNSAGGGGGGSSFVRVNGDSIGYISKSDSLHYFNAMYDLAYELSKNSFSKNEPNGYYIIAYVGTEKPQ